MAADARVVVVGDVHGCLDELRALLAHVGFRGAADVLVLVGDLVGKGPKSAEVVRFAREAGALCVRGNHDDAALAAYYAARAGRPPAPKYAFVLDLSPEDAAFLEQLPFSLALPAHAALVVHAGLVPGFALDHQRPADMYKMRFLQRGEGGAWTALEKAAHAREGAPEPVRWAPEWPGPAHVFFGHAASAGLQVRATRENGCCRQQPLTRQRALSSWSASPRGSIRAAATADSSRRASCRYVRASGQAAGQLSLMLARRSVRSCMRTPRRCTRCRAVAQRRCNRNCSQYNWRCLICTPRNGKARASSSPLGPHRSSFRKSLRLCSGHGFKRTRSEAATASRRNANKVPISPELCFLNRGCL